MNLEILSAIPQSDRRATPILFVHGMWHAAWCWGSHFLPYFAEHGYASYALSLRGHGNSDGRERLRWISLAEYVADVEQVTSQMAQLHPGQMRTPLLVLGAAEDGIILPGEVMATARAFGVKAEIFPGMAHDMMLEADWRMVANRIRTFLDTQAL